MSELHREIVLRFLAQPMDVNFGGKVHGGAVMKWLDQAGYACATQWSGQYCVTVFVGDMNFHQPVHVGELIEVKAKVIHTGKTSMHIALNLQARNPIKGDFLQATHCFMVFVAVDEDGSASSVPAWKAMSQEDVKLEEYALKIMDLRKISQESLRSLQH